MNWESRFSTLVKESSVKIDEAKRRLQNFDSLKSNTSKNARCYPVVSSTALQNARETSHDVLHAPIDINRTVFQAHSLSSSPGSASAALHTLCEKVERQSQVCDLLKTEIEALKRQLTTQQEETENFKEQLDQVSQKVDGYEPDDGRHTLHQWKTEIQNELKIIKEQLHGTKRDDNHAAENKIYLCDTRNASVNESGDLVVNCLQEIKNRLNRIEDELSNHHCDTENTNKMFEQNMTSLMDWKRTNNESLTRLLKMQDLSGDEVKHLRSKLNSIEDKVNELAASITGSVHDDGSVHGKESMTSQNSQLRSHTSLSSEEERSDLTGSSLSLNGIDNEDISLELDEFHIEDGSNNKKLQGSISELTNSSVYSLSDSDNSLSNT